MFHIKTPASFASASRTSDAVQLRKCFPGFFLAMITISKPTRKELLLTLNFSLKRLRILLRVLASLTLAELMENPKRLRSRPFGITHSTKPFFLNDRPFLYIALNSFDFSMCSFLQKAPSGIIPSACGVLFSVFCLTLLCRADLPSAYENRVFSFS